MNSIDKLTEIFSKFPGIGPRQAKRFVYYLLSRNSAFISDFIESVEDLKKEISECKMCMRHYSRSSTNQEICSTCADATRDKSSLMVVPRDVDYEAVQKSGSFKGYYFVLGGMLPILEKEPEKRIRIRELAERIKKSNGEIKEIILAMNATGEGENTSDFIKDMFKAEPITFSTLGRGLSTGAELEYADPETLKNALLHRTK